MRSKAQRTIAERGLDVPQLRLLDRRLSEVDICRAQKAAEDRRRVGSCAGALVVHFIYTGPKEPLSESVMGMLSMHVSCQ